VSILSVSSTVHTSWTKRETPQQRKWTWRSAGLRKTQRHERHRPDCGVSGRISSW